MSLYIFLFYVFAAFTVLSAAFILITKNVLYATFALVLSFLGVAALYVMAGAEFVAVSQIVVYVGGVLVLMVFGIMLTNKVSGKVMVSENHNRFAGILLGAGLFFILYYAIVKVNYSALAWIENAQTQTHESQVQKLGVLLMSDYLLPFEITAVLLLIILIGAVYIADWKSENI